ncbi:MAG: YdcF family protein [Terriglobia bacterium]
MKEYAPACLTGDNPMQHDTMLNENSSLPGNGRNPSTGKEPGRPHRRRTLSLAAVIIVLAGAALIMLLRFGGDALVRTDPLPAHADVAVVLDGGIVGLRARTAGGVRLLQQGVVGHLLLSLPPKTYWGKSVPREAASYFRKGFGKQVMARMAFCVSNADSTIEEEGAVQWCLKTAGWNKVIVVTSNYHTRRAGNIWRSALRRSKSAVQLWVDGVEDGSFQPRGWWRNRRYVKTWLFEGSKLAWESVFGDGPWKQPTIKAELFNPAFSRRPAIRSPSPSP